MNQLDLFQSRINRDAGIKKAVDHAGENWSEKAYQFLLQFIRHDKVFMAEQVREASAGIVPEPPSQRSWGAIILRAYKAGIIVKKGYGSVSNPKAHRTPAAIWEAA